MNEIVVTKDNFEKEVISFGGIVLVDFWASWCGPCRALGPVMSEIAETEDMKVGKVNVDEERDLAEKFNVMSIPTVKVFSAGKEVGGFVGFMTKEDILNYVKKVVG